MIKVMFVCHGNICRSPMAEFVLKDMVNKKNLKDKFYISSSATSNEALGQPVHRGTRQKLSEHGISTEGKIAVRLTKADYENYDYFIAMDSYNVKNILNIFGDDRAKKIHKLLEFAGSSADIADPWYTGNFNDTYNDVVRGCEGFLHQAEKKLRQ